MVLRDTAMWRNSPAWTPYNPQVWHGMLADCNLLYKYPKFTHQLKWGFDAGIPAIKNTFTPPNSLTISQNAVSASCLIQMSLTKVDTSVCFWANAGKAEQHRLIQNLSFPRQPSDITHSINSMHDPSSYPCTWGSFQTICLTVWHLPRGSQAAVQDVAEAYRTMGIAARQWASLVVRLKNSNGRTNTSEFAMLMAICFGLSPGGGLFGNLADILANFLRHKDIGPVSHWVDDNLFFCVRRKFLGQYNAHHTQCKRRISKKGIQHKCAWIWYAGKTMPDDRVEEFDNNCTTMLFNLSE